MSPNSFDTEVNLDELTYQLPENRIAKTPLPDRSKSKLLHYENGLIHHSHFENIGSLLPKETHLVFNNTKVIPARLIFQKDTGARIEIFLLDPIAPSNNYESIMAGREACEWRVMIGNAKKWKEGILEQVLLDYVLKAERTGSDRVRFSWNNPLSFSEILEKAGKIPLPPYIGREATEEDRPRYQTVYSKLEGAVAAPTAGLHFTKKLLDDLANQQISTDYLTLHVSAGTFQPIKAQRITDHPMHREQVVITKQNIQGLLKNELVIPVGTTSMRTLESLFWYGNKLEKDKDVDFFVEKLAPYNGVPITRNKALENVLEYLENRGLEQLIGHTEIFIFQGYNFQICKGLITNFHLPGSTLILLVAALIGKDWKKVYQEALSHNYRFLSYGDSSLLLPNSY